MRPQLPLGAFNLHRVGFFRERGKVTRRIERRGPVENAGQVGLIGFHSESQPDNRNGRKLGNLNFFDVAQRSRGGVREVSRCEVSRALFDSRTPLVNEAARVEQGLDFQQ